MHSIRYGFYSAAEHESWGTGSSPLIAAEQLRLNEHLQQVPENGVIVDVGAGVSLSLAAATYVQRPDITVISVDPGFSLGSGPELMGRYHEETISLFPTDQQEKLRAGDKWHQRVVAGYAEELPVQSGVADLVVSYAAMPEYTAPVSFDECVRVLKLGGMAILGPMQPYIYNDWLNLAQETRVAGDISGVTGRAKMIEAARGYDVDVGFIEIIK